MHGIEDSAGMEDSVGTYRMEDSVGAYGMEDSLGTYGMEDSVELTEWKTVYGPTE